MISGPMPSPWATVMGSSDSFRLVDRWVCDGLTSISTGKWPPETEVVHRGTDYESESTNAQETERNAPPPVFTKWASEDFFKEQLYSGAAF